MKNSILVFLAAMALIFTGCGNKADYESDVSISKSAVKGFYGFDGTGEKLRERGSVIGKLWREFDGPKIYFPGQDLVASTAEAQTVDAVKRICEQKTIYGVTHLYMSGYSRGAIIAVEVANRIQKVCGEGLKLQWMGLVDAVDIGIWKFSHRVPDGMAALHIRKHKQRIFPPEPHTRQIKGHPMANLTFEFDHNHIGYEKDVYDFLNKHARKMGAQFENH
jgi:hypothetical protein